MKVQSNRGCVAALLLPFVAGCSDSQPTERPGGESPAAQSSESTDDTPAVDEVVDGGVVKNVDRDRVETYFDALAKVQSAEEEKQLLTEFAEWLRKNGYKIEVEEKEGKHVLLCNCFPPVTPWTSHTFLDVKNLELLPQ